MRPAFPTADVGPRSAAAQSAAQGSVDQHAALVPRMACDKRDVQNVWRPQMPLIMGPSLFRECFRPRPMRFLLVSLIDAAGLAYISQESGKRAPADRSITVRIAVRLGLGTDSLRAFIDRLGAVRALATTVVIFVTQTSSSGGVLLC